MGDEILGWAGEKKYSIVRIFYSFNRNSSYTP
jgi:hypothetical protein